MTITSNRFKAVLLFVGCIALAVAGIYLAWYTLCHQRTAQPLPNGHGGKMPYGYGYGFAFTLELMCVAWFLTALRQWRSGIDK